MQKSAHYVKSVILAFFLFAETSLIIYLLSVFVKNQNYFSPPIETAVGVSAILLLLSYTITLTVGAWDKWEQFLIVTAPISLGVFITIFPLNNIYGLILATATALLVAHGIYLSSSIHGLLIKFIPNLMMRPAIKSVYFALAIVAAGLVLINPTEEDLKIGKKIGEFAQDQASLITQQDPNLEKAVGSGLLNINVEEEVTNTVEKFIDPYKQFITPLIATLVFAAVQGLGTLVYLIFSITSKPFIWFAKKTNFLISETKTVEQETLKF